MRARAAAQPAAPGSVQAYPAKPVRYHRPAPRRAAARISVARLMAHKLAEAFGKQVIVDNRPGAGSTLGFEFGMKAAPDGYTLTMIHAELRDQPEPLSMRFDRSTISRPSSRSARGPYVIVVHPSVLGRGRRGT
jgi:tripartite-type tricarboxylate transporter receptor subunit TctC